MNSLASEAKRRLSEKIESLSLQIKQREDRKQIFWSSIEIRVKHEPISEETDKEIRHFFEPSGKIVKRNRTKRRKHRVLLRATLSLHTNFPKSAEKHLSENKSKISDLLQVKYRLAKHFISTFQ